MTTNILMQELASWRAESIRQSAEIARLKREFLQMALICQKQGLALEGLVEVVESMLQREAIDRAVEAAPRRRAVN